MLDAVRKYVEAGREAAPRLAGDLLQWSQKNSERFRETIRREVKRQISRSGLATKDDLEPLKRRIRALESSRSTSRRTTSSKSRTGSTSRKSRARKPTSAGSRKRTSSGG
jgi:hypothetical protein